MTAATATAPPTRQGHDGLARLCLDHLALEEAHVRATLASLRTVRAALLANDQAALDDALMRHEGTVRRGEELRRARDGFRQEIGELLGLAPGEVNLSLLCSRLPADAGATLSARQEGLRRDAAEADHLNRSNAVLLHYCLDFLQRFFQDLTGRPAEVRYGPAGALRDTPSGSLIDARG